jgi:hypothetical protein
MLQDVNRVPSNGSEGSALFPTSILYILLHPHDDSSVGFQYHYDSKNAVFCNDRKSIDDDGILIRMGPASALKTAIRSWQTVEHL